MNNNIFKRQNESEMLQLITSQHYTYSLAKKWNLFLFILMVIIPLIINAITAFIPKDSTILLSLFSFFSLCILISGPIIDYRISNLKNVGALIQQKFDCYIYGLNLYDEIHDDEIESFVNKYGDLDFDRKKDWYENHSKLEQNLGIFYSQKENVTWSSDLLSKYYGFSIVIAIIMVIFTVINFILFDKNISTILCILSILFPWISYCINSFIKIRKSKENIRKLKRRIQIIESYISSNNDIFSEIQKLQIDIFLWRKEMFLIPDWFEAKNYKRIQTNHKKTASRINKKMNRKQKKR